MRCLLGRMGGHRNGLLNNMNYEQLITAKIKYVQADAIAGLWIGGAFIALAVVLAFAAVMERRKQDSYADWPGLAFVIASVALLVGGACASTAFYEYKMADLKVRADTANYQLIELVK